MKQFKIRASASSNIMGLKGLGKTGETYLKLWIKEQLYNRRKEFANKYTQKGNEVEDNSLDFVADKLGFGMIIKNDKSFENEYMTGTPDAILNDLVIDVKNSWDFSTFPLLDKTCPNSDYYWQAQCYMALTGIKRYKLIYTLVDTPLHLIEKEAYWHAKNNGYEELEQSMYEDFVKRMTYADIPDELKIKVFDIEYNEADVQRIYDRVNECRIFIDAILKK